jgi:hypothetical protein
VEISADFTAWPWLQNRRTVIVEAVVLDVAYSICVDNSGYLSSIRARGLFASLSRACDLPVSFEHLSVHNVYFAK